MTENVNKFVKKYRGGYKYYINYLLIKDKLKERPRKEKPFLPGRYRMIRIVKPIKKLVS